MASPSLLGIPSEIRQQILSYFFQGFRAVVTQKEFPSCDPVTDSPRERYLLYACKALYRECRVLLATPMQLDLQLPDPSSQIPAAIPSFYYPLIERVRVQFNFSPPTVLRKFTSLGQLELIRLRRWRRVDEKCSQLTNSAEGIDRLVHGALDDLLKAANRDEYTYLGRTKILSWIGKLVEEGSRVTVIDHFDVSWSLRTREGMEEGTLWLTYDLRTLKTIKRSLSRFLDQHVTSKTWEDGGITTIRDGVCLEKTEWKLD